MNETTTIPTSPMLHLSTVKYQFPVPIEWQLDDDLPVQFVLNASGNTTGLKTVQVNFLAPTTTIHHLVADTPVGTPPTTETLHTQNGTSTTLEHPQNGDLAGGSQTNAKNNKRLSPDHVSLASAEEPRPLSRNIFSAPPPPLPRLEQQPDLDEDDQPIINGTHSHKKKHKTSQTTAPLAMADDTTAAIVENPQLGMNGGGDGVEMSTIAAHPRQATVFPLVRGTKFRAPPAGWKHLRKMETFPEGFDEMVKYSYSLVVDTEQCEEIAGYEERDMLDYMNERWKRWKSDDYTFYIYPFGEVAKTPEGEPFPCRMQLKINSITSRAQRLFCIKGQNPTAQLGSASAFWEPFADMTGFEVVKNPDTGKILKPPKPAEIFRMSVMYFRKKNRETGEVEYYAGNVLHICPKECTFQKKKDSSRHSTSSSRSDRKKKKSSTKSKHRSNKKGSKGHRHRHHRQADDLLEQRLSEEEQVIDEDNQPIIQQQHAEANGNYEDNVDGYIAATDPTAETVEDVAVQQEDEEEREQLNENGGNKAEIAAQETLENLDNEGSDQEDGSSSGDDESSAHASDDPDYYQERSDAEDADDDDDHQQLVQVGINLAGGEVDQGQQEEDGVGSGPPDQQTTQQGSEEPMDRTSTLEEPTQ